MKLSPLAGPLLLLAMPAWAGCASGTDQMFRCTTSGGAKTLEICYGDQTARYRFGKTGAAPELELFADIAALYYRPWNGVGRSIYEEVGFQNGDYEYLVHGALDRMILEEDEEWPLSGGVSVVKADETVALIDCDPKSVEHQLDAFFDAKEAAGKCWHFQSFEWRDSCAEN